LLEQILHAVLDFIGRVLIPPFEIRPISLPQAVPSSVLVERPLPLATILVLSVHIVLLYSWVELLDHGTDASSLLRVWVIAHVLLKEALPLLWSIRPVTEGSLVGRVSRVVKGIEVHPLRKHQVSLDVGVRLRLELREALEAGERSGRKLFLVLETRMVASMEVGWTKRF